MAEPRSSQSRWNDEDTDNRYVTRLELARELGAVAVVAIERDDWGAKLEDGREAMRRFFLPFNATASAAEGPPLAVGSAAVAEALLGSEARPDRQCPPFRTALLPGVTATISASGSERVLDSRNVLGVIPGADPAAARPGGDDRRPPRPPRPRRAT